MNQVFQFSSKFGPTPDNKKIAKNNDQGHIVCAAKDATRVACGTRGFLRGKLTRDDDIQLFNNVASSQGDRVVAAASTSISDSREHLPARTQGSFSIS
jgi:hypothetical protein